MEIMVNILHNRFVGMDFLAVKNLSDSNFFVLRLFLPK